MLLLAYRHLKCQQLKICCHISVRNLSKDVTTPMTRYSSLLEKGILNVDKEQFKAVNKIQELYNDLKDYVPLIEADNKTGDVPQGLFLYGGVGTGKTLLLDLFYDSIPTTQKKRVHFHAFMLYLYSEMNRWNLCLEEDVDFVTPMEHVANKIMKDAWLICFDEIQVADYATCSLIDGLLSHMFAKGAVIVGTSNRSPQDLGDVSITEQFDGDLDNVQETIQSFKSRFIDNCRSHNLSTERDHRAELAPGELRYLYPSTIENEKTLDEMFAQLIPKNAKITSSTVSLYGRKVLIPLSVEHIARFSFQELCSQPLGPADYIKICNTYSVVFLENIPKLNMHTRSEARRFITFIDAVYESRVKLYCTAQSSYEQLFLMLPRGEDDYEMEQMQMEMIGEIAYDLKLMGLDFRSLNIISGEDEIFSFKRAISRLKEIQSAFYQSTNHRPQEFVPYIGSRDEIKNADDNRRSREKRRQEKLDEIDRENGKDSTNIEGNVTQNHVRDYTDTDWGDEASYLTTSKEVSSLSEKRSTKIDDRTKDLPHFGDQHFWGFGWWEKVRKKWIPKEEK